MMQKRYTSHIHSFVKRSGRLTKAQSKALNSTFSCKIDFDPHLSLPECFVFKQNTVMEIGFGMGDFLLNYAQYHPEKNIIGVDVYPPGIARCLSQVSEQGWHHVLILEYDAVEILKEMIPAESLSEIFVFFPDPWPKKRHHKRRFFSPYTLSLLHSRLQEGGRIVSSTDDVNYAAQIVDVFRVFPGFLNHYGHKQLGCHVRESSCLGTKYERKALEKGHMVYDFIYEKV